MAVLLAFYLADSTVRQWSLLLVLAICVVQCEDSVEESESSGRRIGGGYPMGDYRVSAYTMGDIFRGTLLRRENVTRTENATRVVNNKRYSARIPSSSGYFPGIRRNVHAARTPDHVQLDARNGHVPPTTIIAPPSAENYPEAQRFKNGYEGFKMCLKDSLREDGTDEVFTSCVKSMLVQNLRRIVQSKRESLSVFGGLMELKKFGQWPEPVQGRVDEQDEDVLEAEPVDWEVARGLDNFSKTFALRTEVFPGVNLRLARSTVPNTINFGIDLDDEDDVDEGRDQKKKKKKKLLKKLKKLLPLLLIPFAIQALILPLFIASLKMLALKAVMVGKLAILVTLLTYVAKNHSRSDNDVYAEEIASEHYGYDGGMEYGAWVNGRDLGDGRSLAYRGHAR